MFDWLTNAPSCLLPIFSLPWQKWVGCLFYKTHYVKSQVGALPLRFKRIDKYASDRINHKINILAFPLKTPEQTSSENQSSRIITDTLRLFLVRLCKIECYRFFTQKPFFWNADFPHTLQRRWFMPASFPLDHKSRPRIQKGKSKTPSIHIASSFLPQSCSSLYVPSE